MPQNAESFSGTLEAIRFKKGSFIIGKLDNGTGIKGTMIDPQVGMEYEFKGYTEHHPRFGATFVFSEYHASLPTDGTGIRIYLIENCKWIGPEVSKALINKYGPDTLKICKEDPERVWKEIKGITPKRAKEIQAMLMDNEENEKLQIQLNEMLAGIRMPRNVIGRVVELWKHEAPARIRENPFQLIDEVKYVGFTIADAIATKVGFKHDGPARILAGVVHCLKEMAMIGGHTAPLRGLFLEKASDLLGLEEGVIEKTISTMPPEQIVMEGNRIALTQLYRDESEVAKKLVALLKENGYVRETPFEAASSELEDLKEDQIKALGLSRLSPVFILTGAPGTGKTYTIKRIIDDFPNARVKLAAPTGKAAKRMFEQTGMKAQTMHKLLEPQMEGEKFVFTRDSKRPIEADLVVLDEVSMIDVSLMAKFLDALPLTTRLVMVGDTYQLPSVGPGNILKDCIASEKIPFCELTEIKRQDEGMIIRNCHRIKNGENIQIDNASSTDFFFLPAESEEQIRTLIVELVKERLPKKYSMDPLKDIQVITPLREKTLLSCKHLNTLLQYSFLGGTGSEKFLVEDKVIQLKNDYKHEIINGDIGYIREIDPRRKEIVVTFENPEREIGLPLTGNDLGLAYAVTCHKYQGSEVPIAVIPIHRSFGPLLMQRNWLYTAISRAKKVCVLVGQQDEIPKIIERNQQQKRFTRLKELLK